MTHLAGESFAKTAMQPFSLIAGGIWNISCCATSSQKLTLSIKKDEPGC